MSNRWIRGVLRGDLRFQGAVFSDDLSMAGAAAAGDIVTRAERALAAGCDVLPVCNNPAGVVTLLNQLKIEPEPASQLRIVRMRGREALSREALMASQAWRSSQEALARSAAAPALNLESGNA
jgi:beta-N-acetylhexosaminidase